MGGSDSGTEGAGRERLEEDIEVSAHHRFYDGHGGHIVEYEVHTGFADEYFMSEELARRVYAEIGLDLWSGDYRSGSDIQIVETGDTHNTDSDTP